MPIPPRVGVLGILIVFAAGCASVIAVPEELPARADLSANEGTVVGSILLSAPTAPPDSDLRHKAVAELKKARYEATVRRYVPHDYALGEWTEWVGPSYQIIFEVGAEKRFVLRGTPGNYEVQRITELGDGVLGIRAEGCTMTDVASFRIRPASTTYVGRLSIEAGFMEGIELSQVRAWESVNGMHFVHMPERFLKMRVRVVPDETARGGTDPDLMSVQYDKANWGYFPDPPPSPPGAPPNPR